MNAKQVIEFVNEYVKERIFIRPSESFEVIEDNMLLFNKVFDLAQEIEPFDEWRDGTDRMFWINEENEWFYLYLAEHNKRRGIILRNRNFSEYYTLRLENRVSKDDKYHQRRREKKDFTSVLSWIIDAEKKCIAMIKDGSYNDFISKKLPYIYRSGAIKLKDYWRYVPEDKERLFGNIKSAHLQEYIEWSGDVEGYTHLSQKDYFEACNCIYDALKLKEAYPILKHGTPRDYYMAYGNWGYTSVDDFKSLNENDSEEFEAYIEGRLDKCVDHHVWECCLVPSIKLEPIKVNGKYYFNMYTDRGDEEYKLQVELTLALKDKGFPILKSSMVEEKLSGEEWVLINPHCADFDWIYANILNIFRGKTSNSYIDSDDNEIVGAITWFPLRKWSVNTPKIKILELWKEYNSASDKSIRDSFQNSKYENQDLILEYLKNGRIIARLPISSYDITTDAKIHDYKLLITDDKYLWNSELIYYIEKYNLRLPKEFEEKIIHQSSDDTINDGKND